ncbi:MAG TPA: hypothetical protein PJ987_11915 [Bacteroidia bacterium]|nr:hypothetical protein [Bacteroidia bacterium]HMY42156.1 hypothetical protein [Chitinophagales bacterium]
MTINIYSSGKKREGGYSGISVFEHKHKESLISVSHCSTAAVAAPFHKMYILRLDLCKNHLNIEYIAYDDCEDYKTVNQILGAGFPDEEKNILFKKMILSKIKIGKNFNIENFIEEVFELGIEEGKTQKIEEIKKVLYL